jgi:hypothetical protein
MALSTYEKVGRVVADGSFITRVTASVTAKAVAEGNPSVDALRFLHPVANALSGDFDAAITTDDEDGAETAAAIAALSDADIDTAVAGVYNTVAGIKTETGAALTSTFARDYLFQNRVYQIGAGLANSILVTAPPTVADPDNPTAQETAAKAIDGIKRIFALKYQAGRYGTPAHKENYAVNVLADPDLAVKTPDEITDEEILTRLTELVAIFANSMAAFKAAGIDTGLLT